MKASIKYWQLGTLMGPNGPIHSGYLALVPIETGLWDT